MVTELAEPAEVVTPMGPVVAPEGTVAVIWFGSLTVNVDDLPLKETVVTPLKPEPVMTTLLPMRPLVGVKPVTEGRTVKGVELVAEVDVVTVIYPVVAVDGTLAVIWDEETTVAVAGTPLNETVAPSKLAPVIVTVVPVTPLVGVKPEMVKGPTTVKFVELVTVPDEVVTVIFPVVALLGTVAVNCVDELIVNPALTPLNFTELVLPNPDPVIMTLVPIAPLEGVKLVNWGVTLKLLVLSAYPVALYTEICPVLAEEGTIAEIWVEELIVKLAVTPPKRTSVISDNPVPLIITVEPTVPLTGEKLVRLIPEDDPVTIKSVGLSVVPEGVVTDILPVDAPVGTIACIEVDDRTV